MAMSRSALAVAAILACAAVVAVAHAPPGGPAEDDAAPGGARDAGLVCDEQTGLCMIDFIGEPAAPEYATPEMVERSRRAREALGPEPPRPEGAAIHVPPSAESRFRAARAAILDARERHRRREEAGFPAVRAEVVPPDDAVCGHLCAHVLFCLGSTEAADRQTCLTACRRGAFGGKDRAAAVLELRSCQHL